MASYQEAREKKSDEEEEQRQQQEGHDRAAMSPQEAQEYRATAQQNSIVSIRAAEERYEKARQSGSAALLDTKEAVVHGLGATATYLTGKGTQAAGYAADLGKQGYEAAKDTTFTAGQKAAELAEHAAMKTKDSSLSAAGYTSEKAKEGYEATKDSTLTAAERAAELAKHAGAQIKDTSLSAAEYTQQAAMKTTDLTLDYAKTALEKAKEMLAAGKEEAEETKEMAREKAEKAELSPDAVESSKGRTEEAGQKAANTLEEDTTEAKGKLDEQIEKSKEKMRELSISEEEREGIKGKQASDEQRKVGDEVATEAEREPGEGYVVGEKIAVGGSEPGAEIADRGGKSIVSEAGAIFEAVGETVIEAAETAKEKVMGREPEREE